MQFAQWWKHQEWAEWPRTTWTGKVDSLWGKRYIVEEVDGFDGVTEEVQPEKMIADTLDEA